MFSKIIKYILLVIYLVVNIGLLKAQNLVYNGSFEIRENTYQGSSQDSSNCPCAEGKGFDAYNPQLEMAKGWYDPEDIYRFEKSSSDFYHFCGNDTNNLADWWNWQYDMKSIVSVPDNQWHIGYQYPRTGLGYVGGVSPGLNYWNQETGEYIQSILLNILEPNKTYMVSFYTVRGNMCGCSIETQGAFISKQVVNHPTLISSLLNDTLNAQMINNTYINDTLNWTKIEGEFVAKGDEQYITIGNMVLFDYHPIIVDSTSLLPNSACYAYDDVALYEKGAPFWTADAGRDTIICFGDSVQIGTTNVPEQYKAEYFYEWFITGNERNIISYLEQPIFAPTTTTTYVLKLTDFKYDKTYDTIRVEVINCTNKPEVIVYPNPAIDWVKFEFNTLLPANTKIQLFDIAGRLVQEQQFNPAADQQELELQLKNLAQGVYGFSVLFDDRRATSGKIIILK